MALPFYFQLIRQIFFFCQTKNLSKIPINYRYDMNSEIDFMWGGFPESSYVR